MPVEGADDLLSIGVVTIARAGLAVLALAADFEIEVGALVEIVEIERAEVAPCREQQTAIPALAFFPHIVFVRPP